MSYTLALKEETITIDGKNYVLREATSNATKKYRNAVLRATKYNNDGNLASADGLADVEPLLVSMCLFEVDGDSRSKPVTLEKIGEFPGNLVRSLYRKAKILSNIDQPDNVDNIKQAITELQDRLVELETTPKN